MGNCCGKPNDGDGNGGPVNDGTANTGAAVVGQQGGGPPGQGGQQEQDQARQEQPHAGQDEAPTAQGIQAQGPPARAGPSGLSRVSTLRPPQKEQAGQRQKEQGPLGQPQTETSDLTPGSPVKRYIPDVQPIFKRATPQEEQEDYDRDVIRNQNINSSAKRAVQQFQRVFEKSSSVRHYTSKCTSLCKIS